MAKHSALQPAGTARHGGFDVESCARPLAADCETVFWAWSVLHTTQWPRALTGLGLKYGRRTARGPCRADPTKRVQRRALALWAAVHCVARPLQFPAMILSVSSAIVPGNSGGPGRWARTARRTGSRRLSLSAECAPCPCTLATGGAGGGPLSSRILESVRSRALEGCTIIRFISHAPPRGPRPAYFFCFFRTGSSAGTASPPSCFSAPAYFLSASKHLGQISCDPSKR